MKNILNKAFQWLSDSYDDSTQKEVKFLIKSDINQLIDSFYKDVEFGTGGIRAIMGVGTNRINKYTIGVITLALIRYLKKEYNNKFLSVVIAHDVRKNSDIFANIVASIFSAENIKVYLFDNFRPTPELSYAVRKLSCQAGIVLTASHNLPEYNGYKIYGKDGSQIVFPEDQKIMEEMRNVCIKDIYFKSNKKMIQYIGKEMDNSFIKNCIKHASFTSKGKNLLKIVFTSLHGTSIIITPKAFYQAGFKKVFIVKKQSVPDGRFITVNSPNPEDPESFSMALSLAKKQQADIILSADPDADRFGVAVRDENEKIILLNGNQSNTLLIYYLLKRWKEKGDSIKKPFITSTIVSSDIFLKIAKIFKVKCKISLTGFKWIAKLIKESKESEKFIGGGEESFGFMVGDFIRDKDSITPMLLIAEIAAIAKANGSSIYKELLGIYMKTGCYQEFLISLVRKGNNGYKEISNIINKWRKHPPEKIYGSKVILIDDYQYGIRKNLLRNTENRLRFPKSNIIVYRTKNNIKIAIRPSGTEPKIKFYISVKSSLYRIKDYPLVREQLNLKIQNIIHEMKIL